MIRRALATVVLVLGLLAAGIYIGGHPGGLPDFIRNPLVGDQDTRAFDNALDTVASTYYLKIGRKHVAALAQALQGPPAAPEAGVLELMQQRFGGGAENPFEAIKQLLLDRQIPFDDSVW